MSVMDEPRPQSRTVRVMKLNEFLDDPDGRRCDACGETQPRGCSHVVYIGWHRAELCLPCRRKLDEECGDEVRESLRSALKQIRGCASCKALGLCEIHAEKLKEIAA